MWHCDCFVKITLISHYITNYSCFFHTLDTAQQSYNNHSHSFSPFFITFVAALHTHSHRNMKFNLLTILTSVISISLALTASAVPAPPYPIEVKCEDGSTVMVNMHGDERSHFFTDLQGHPLMRTDSGFRLASKAEAEVIMASMPQTQAPQVGGSTFPTIGSPRSLVILVEFADNSFTIDNPYEVYSDMLSLPGFDRDGATGSISDYFRDSSEGKFTPQFDLYGPVKLSQPMSYYGANKSNGDDIRPDEMVTEACELLDDIIDFRNYDADGDGVIDNVYIFYAGYGENDTGIRSAVWPHSWDIALPSPAGAGRTVYFDGLLVNHYACSNELRGGTDNKLSGIGTFVHEFGHVLGLPDLYSTRSSAPFTPGKYSVMDNGSYNNNCHTPPHYSAYERYALGWVDPSPLIHPADVALRCIDRGGYNDVVVINTSNPYEYYLLENRQQSSWDSFIPGHGMILWHIDYDPDIWDQNTVNTSASHLRVDLIEADGIPTSTSRAGDTFPGTAGVTSFNDFRPWTGETIDAPLTEITETPDALITFKFRGGNAGIISATSDPSTLTVPHLIVYPDTHPSTTHRYYDLQGRPVTNPTPGQLLIQAEL